MFPPTVLDPTFFNNLYKFHSKMFPPTVLDPTFFNNLYKFPDILLDFTCKKSWI